MSEDTKGTESAIAPAVETTPEAKDLTPEKKPKSKKKARRYIYVRRRRYAHLSPAEREWATWNHDLDTVLHEMVKDPALHKLSPRAIVKRAEGFADALADLQKRRKPAGVKGSGRFG